MRRLVLLFGILFSLPASASAQHREELVRVAVGPDTLAGTLTLPAGSGPHPAVVLLSGMLQDNRDAPTGEFRTLKVLADTFASLGMAVLRYDDRGVGESTGRSTWEYVLDDHAAEAGALMARLRNRDDIDPGRVGLLGHSYGGPVAARTARRGEAPSLVVLAAPHVATARDIVLGMIRRQELSRGRSSVEADAEALFIDATIGSASLGQRDWEGVRHAIEQHLRPQYDMLPASVRQSQSLDDLCGRDALWPSLERRTHPHVAPLLESRTVR
jgi:pimeloyl-ACP methyl ester carboxylesterase